MKGPGLKGCGGRVPRVGPEEFSGRRGPSDLSFADVSRGPTRSAANNNPQRKSPSRPRLQRGKPDRIQ